MRWETWLTNIKYRRYVSRMQGTMTGILCNEALTQHQRKNGVCQRTQKIGRSSSLRRKPWRKFTSWWDATCHCFNKITSTWTNILETLELREHRNHRPLPCKSSPRLRSPWSHHVIVGQALTPHEVLFLSTSCHLVTYFPMSSPNLLPWLPIQMPIPGLPTVNRIASKNPTNSW